MTPLPAVPAARRPRRCVLFMPGDDAHKIAKGAALGPDSVIMDIEDGTALNRKQAARDTIRSALGSVAFGRTEKLVRVNAFDTGWTREDILSTVAGKPDGYVVPKVESAETVQAVSEWIGQLEALHGFPAGGIRLIAMIETARGVLNVAPIAEADPRVDAILLGSEDLAGDLGATRTREGWEVFYARSAVVTAAAANGLQALDGVYVDLQDTDGLRAECGRVLGMGYGGKSAIHPRQVPVIMDAFTPTAEDVARAQALIAAFEANQRAGAGAFAYEGKMVDMPMLRAAQKVIARAGAGTG
ncbi:MAG: CoA ester lyase [Chloroflexi bacterium]|nr:CoA ester lyase [Chloroflexota bacterium]